MPAKSSAPAKKSPASSQKTAPAKAIPAKAAPIKPASVNPAAAKPIPARPAAGKAESKRPAASPVYFVDLRARAAKESKISKIAKLFKAAGFSQCFQKGDLAAIKVHFGERGNDTFINPVFVRAVVDALKASGANPFITDTNTLYQGSRHNAVDHLHTALEHGYGFATVGAPLIIADGLRGSSFSPVSIKKKHFATVKIADAIVEARALMVLTHFKGHEMAGFGGAIKNLAMGCSPSQGKCDQHATRFEVSPEVCIACGLCMASCPEGAITWAASAQAPCPPAQKGTKPSAKPAGGASPKKVASIDKGKCVGCGECLTVCAPKAVTLNWATEIVPFTERMVEYALGAVIGKPGKTAYINFLMNITPDCDCVPWSDAPIVPDIGILASSDPVALDAACYDLVNKAQGFVHSHLTSNHAPGQDKFKGLWSYTTGEVQLSYAESIGLGSARYKLVSI